MKNLKNLFLGYLLLTIAFGFSQQPHSGGIVVPTGFKITANQPVDDRTVVTSVEDLDSLPNKYAGLICYVEDNESLYYYNGEEWLKVNDDSGLVDAFITVSEITVVDNNVTVGLGLEWRIDGIEHELLSDWEDTIPYTTEGFTRKDIIVATNTGTLLRIQGDEDEENAFQPATPVGTLLLTVIDVYGDFLGDPQEPEIAFGRIKKVGEKWTTAYVVAGGAKGLFPLESYGRNIGVYVYDGGGDFEYGSLRGIGLEQTYQQYPVDELLWDGALIRIQHLPTTANKKLKIRHNDSFDLPSDPNGKAAPFWFPNEEDYVLEPYEILTFIYKKSFSIAYGNDGAFIFLGSNMSSGGGVTYFKEITKDGDFTATKIESGVDAGKFEFKIVGDETLEWLIGNGEYVYNLDSNNEWKFIADELGSGVERRIDAISYGNDGEVHYWKGTETGQASYPNVPENHILKTFVTLTEDGSIIPSSPDLSGYVLKNHFKWGSTVYSAGSGNDVYLSAGSIVGYHNKVVGITNLYPDPELRILGCNINTTLTNKPLWDGVTIRIKFNLVAGKTIRLKNNISGANVPTQAKFLFPDGLDYLPDNNEILTFVLRDTGFLGWKLEFAGSNMSSGGVSGDFIPLSGTEVGKPLTGIIEVDTSNGFSGFYSTTGGVHRVISMSDEGDNLIGNQNYDSETRSSISQGSEYNFITSNGTNRSSHISNTPQSTQILTTDIDDNTAEIVVGDYGTVRFNSDIPDDNISGRMYYNAEEGLQIFDNNSYNYNSLQFNSINGQYNTNSWSIRKDFNDSADSFLLFPDSGTTSRRIPVSVNGNYANQQGDIELELTADNIDYDNAASGLLAETVQEALDEIAEDYVPTSEVTSIATPNKVVQYSNTGNVNTSLAEFPENAVPLFQLNAMLGNYVTLTGNQTVAGVKTFTSSPIVPTATTPTQAVNLGQMTLQGVLDNNNMADGVGIMLTDGSELGQYTVDGFHANSGSIGMSASVTGKGFLYSSANGRVHLGDRDGVVGLNFEDNTYKSSIIPPASLTGNHTHTLQAKSGVLAHLDDIGDVPDGSITNAKLANMAANTIKVRNATTAGVPNDLAISSNRLVGRGSTGNISGITVGGGLSFSGSQLVSDVYRDHYRTITEETLDVWTDDRRIYKITFEGTSTGVLGIDISSLGFGSGSSEAIYIEGMYFDDAKNRQVPCNYRRLIDIESSLDEEITTCYIDNSSARLNLSWHEVVGGTVRPIEFSYKVTIKYILPQ